MRRRDFHYDLPRELIAQTPAARRDASRLLVVGDDGLDDRTFADLPALLPPDAVVVVNDAKVIPARLRGHKPTGGAVELLLLEPLAAPDPRDPAGGHRWRAMARASKPLRAGTPVALAGGGPTVHIATDRAPDGTVEVVLPEPADDLCARWGEVPLPPYIARPRGATREDAERYQTVYARAPGAVAAPTAGLHFTPELLDALPGDVATLTLRVGPGTFAPVRADDLDDHEMHAEAFDIPERTARLVASGRPVVAIGTTVVRALEAYARGDRGATRLFIRPGFAFQVVDLLVTNFHLPESTLLMLVCAFGGTDRVFAAYRHAVAARYRFYSYGDAMLIARAGGRWRTAAPGRRPGAG